MQPKNCPVCNSSAVTPFVTRKNFPVHQNFLYDTQKSAKEVALGSINLFVCEDCGFVFNNTFQSDLVDYSQQPYDNSQNNSSVFNNYLDNLVNYFVFERGVQNSHILEVGCGQGTFLKKLIEVNSVHNIGYGFDAAYVGPKTDLQGKLNFYNCYYNSDFNDIRIDVVFARHVIEHIPSPVHFLATLRQALVKQEHKVRIFFETPCIEWILQNQAFWDFFYEHCSYFSTKSLTTCFEIAGFKVESVQHFFEDQYLGIEATLSQDNLALPTKEPGQIVNLARQFLESEDELKNVWQQKLRHFAQKGNIALWGAGAKGTTFANLLDPEHQWISCVVDINPRKQNKYLAGTGHPIVSPDNLVDYSVNTVLIMNPNYHNEISSIINSLNLDIDLYAV